MMYVVDVNKPSIKQAVNELGIHPECLLLKELEDFQDAEETSNMARLRFDYFIRKQQEYMRLISEKLKQYSVKFRKSSNQKPSVFLTQVSVTQPSPRQENRSIDVQKKQFIKSLKEIQRNLEISVEIDKKIENSRENRQKLLSVKNVRKIMMEKFKEKQAENLEKIRKVQTKSLKKYRLESFTPKERKNQSIEFYNKEDITLNTENDVDEQIKIFEEKMKKSEAIKTFYVKQKKLAIAKMLEKESKRLKPRDNHSDSEKLLKLIEKQEVMKERHKSLVSTKLRYNQKIRDQLQKRLEEAQRKFKEIQNSPQLDKKAKVKIAKSEMVLKKNHDEWVKKLELKNELARFREESIQSEQERYSNMKKHRRNQIIEKQLNDSERLSRLSKLKQQKVDKTLKSLYQGMIEKEKYHELVSDALRSPQSKKLKQKISELETLEKFDCIIHLLNMRRDSLSSLDDITSVFHNQSRTETPIDSIKPSRTNICTPYPLYQQKIRALLKPPDYQRNPPKFMSAREPQSEFERKEAAIQVKLLKKTFNTMHQRFNSVDKVLNILKSEAIKINSLRAVGENDLDHLKRRLEDLESEEDLMLSKIREEFNNNVIYKHIRERMRITLMHLEVKNQLLTDKIRVRDFLIESEHRKKTKTLENKYTKAQAYKNLKKTVHLDFKDRSADLEILSEDIKTREKIHELRRTRIKKYEEIAETAANEERDLKNNNKREAVQINSFWANFLKSKLEFYKRKYQKIVSAYERIQNVTMVSGIEEVVSRFLIKEQNFSELMGILSHNKEKCLKMIKKNDLIEGKIDDLLLSQKGGLDQNIANMKENLSFCISRTQKANQRLTRIRIVRDKVKSWSLKMMTKLGIRNNPRFCLREIFSLIQTEIFTRLQTKDRKSKGMFVTEL